MYQIPICGVFLIFSILTHAQTEPMRNDFLSKWDNATSYTIEVAEAMPAAGYAFQPTEDVRSFADQLIHMADNMIWLSSTYLAGEAFTKEVPEGKEAILDYLKRSLDYTRQTLETLDLSTLDEEVQFFAGPMTRRRVVLLVNDHLTHHRGQLILYLRLQGIQPPRYRGW
jgi:uncharacterized damage-inducible protein DinB